MTPAWSLGFSPTRLNIKTPTRPDIHAGDIVLFPGIDGPCFGPCPWIPGLFSSTVIELVFLTELRLFFHRGLLNCSRAHLATMICGCATFEYHVINYVLLLSISLKIGSKKLDRRANELQVENTRTDRKSVV